MNVCCWRSLPGALRRYFNNDLNVVDCARLAIPGLQFVKHRNSLKQEEYSSLKLRLGLIG